MCIAEMKIDMRVNSSWKEMADLALEIALVQSHIIYSFFEYAFEGFDWNIRGKYIYTERMKKDCQDLF